MSSEPGSDPNEDSLFQNTYQPIKKELKLRNIEILLHSATQEHENGSILNFEWSGTDVTKKATELMMEIFVAAFKKQDITAQPEINYSDMSASIELHKDEPDQEHSRVIRNMKYMIDIAAGAINHIHPPVGATLEEALNKALIREKGLATARTLHVQPPVPTHALASAVTTPAPKISSAGIDYALDTALGSKFPTAAMAHLKRVLGEKLGGKERPEGGVEAIVAEAYGSITLDVFLSDLDPKTQGEARDKEVRKWEASPEFMVPNIARELEALYKPARSRPGT